MKARNAGEAKWAKKQASSFHDQKARQLHKTKMGFKHNNQKRELPACRSRCLKLTCLDFRDPLRECRVRRSEAKLIHQCNRRSRSDVGTLEYIHSQLSTRTQRSRKFISVRIHDMYKVQSRHSRYSGYHSSCSQFVNCSAMSGRPLRLDESNCRLACGCALMSLSAGSIRLGEPVNPIGSTGNLSGLRV